MIRRLRTERTGIAATCDCPVCSGLTCLERPRYFAGQLLTEQELNDTQAYVLAKNRLHNRYLHGVGIVCGLQVVCHDCEGWVTVQPGYALDQCGNDILVCQPHDFDLIAAIRACKEQGRRERDCDPLREAFRANCDDGDETWCITIRYRENEGQPTAALVNTSPGSCGCGSGARKGSCGCHKNGNGNGRSTVANACEPTRVLEQYELGVMPAPTASDTDDDLLARIIAGLEELGFHVPLDEMIACFTTLMSYIERGAAIAQLLEEDPFGSRLTIYNDLCRLRNDLREFLLENNTLTCDLLRRLSLVVCPPPPQTDDGLPAFVAGVQTALLEIGRILVAWFIDCICYAALPTCPADPCEDRLILACVTVNGDRIRRICHTEGRRYVLTPHNAISAFLNLFLDDLCCGALDLGQDNTLATGFDGGFANASATTFAGFAAASPRFAFGSDFAGSIFSGFRMAQAEERAAVEFVGRPSNEVRDALAGQEVEIDEVTVNWSGERAALRNLAAARVRPGQPVRLYVDEKSGRVVGLQSLTETDLLRRDLARATVRINNLEQELQRRSSNND